MRALVALLLLISCMPLSWAQDVKAPDVRMVIDVSGSMKVNDPANLRAGALELAVSLLPPEARGGLWLFGTQVRNPLPSRQVNDDWRERLLSLTSQLSDYQQFTDIEAAIRQAAAAPPTDEERHLIVLSDGMVDLPARGGNKAARDEASRNALLEELAPRLAEQDVVIHPIALSNKADLALFERLAQETGGLAALAETPEALLRAFLDVLDRILPADQVPLENQRFTIDDEIDAFTALLFHDPQAPPLVLIAPDGQRYSAADHPDTIRWQRDSRYDLIKVPDPQEGQWRIEGELGDDSRIAVTSSLVLRSSELPATLYQGFEVPLDIWLENEGRTLTASELPADISLRVELRSLEGQVYDAVSLTQEGEHFRGQLPGAEQLGNARLALIAESEAFSRQRVQGVNVIPAITATLSNDEGHVVLQAQYPELNASNTQIHAQLLGDTLEAQQTGAREWQIDLPSLDPSRSVPLELEATITLDGNTRTLRLPDVRLNPDARIGVSGASERQALEAESLADDREETGPPADQASPSLAEVADAVFARARSELQKVPSYLQQHMRSPLGWVLLALVLIMIVFVMRRRRRAKRRKARRQRQRQPQWEEPHL
ncbi:VWA domain-containing protein [Halomonas sp. WWR20]